MQIRRPWPAGLQRLSRPDSLQTTLRGEALESLPQEKETLEAGMTDFTKGFGCDNVSAQIDNTAKEMCWKLFYL